MENSSSVAALMETAETYDGCQSLQSDSERSQMVLSEKKRFACICHIGDACRIMSTAFHTMKDPRGCYIVVPAYEVQLREAYCRHLRPDYINYEDIDELDDFVVAVHHFHPTIIDRCFNTEFEERPEENVLPMPARTTASSTALEYLLDDRDRVVCHQTGAPTGDYWVVPSYPFDAAHGDLKESMGHMPDHELERCVRRMKREARRQKWEAIVHKWETVSKRSSLRSNRFEIATTSNEDMPALRDSSPNSVLKNQREKLYPCPPQTILQTSAPSLGYVTTAVPDGCTRPPSFDEEENEELGHIRRGSLMTAQEMLESELGEDDTIPDLNEDDELFWSRPIVQTSDKEDQRQREEVPSPMHPGCVVVESDPDSVEHVPDLDEIEEQDSSESEALISNGVDVGGGCKKAPMIKTSEGDIVPQIQDDDSLSSLSNEGSADAEGGDLEPKTPTPSSSPRGSSVEMNPVLESPCSVLQLTSKEESQPLCQSTDTCLVEPEPRQSSVLWTLNEVQVSARNILKSRPAAIVVAGAFFICVGSMAMRLTNCAVILKSREEAFI